MWQDNSTKAKQEPTECYTTITGEESIKRSCKMWSDTGVGKVQIIQGLKWFSKMHR